ncbi:MAG TPA: NAD+ synthase [Nitrospirales bacterium]|nr:NAD+ synthase [Nitrospirales bacterium]HIN32623.1 NAD+ synthase [Nitrospirales bacterium]
MTPFRLAQAQINCTVGDLIGNTEKICQWIQRARALNADLVSFPELTITGYPPEDLVLKPQFVADNIDALQVVAAEAKGIVVVVGFVDYANGLYNAAAVLAHGKVQGVYHKHHLPNYGVFDEKRYFLTGREQHVLVVNGVSVGLNICEDMWAPRGPIRIQASGGATVIVNISASPYQIGKIDERERMLRTRAKRNLAIVAFNNLVGGQDELVFDGRSMIVDHEGHLLARGKAFEEDLVVADINIQDVLESRKHKQSRSDRPSTRMQSVTRIVCSDKPYAGTRVKVSPSVGETLTTCEEVYRALCLGIRDYVSKNGFSSVAIGLSGGIDSALTAALAVDALSPRQVLGVFMPSRHTSQASRVDVESLVRNLGIHLRTISIEEAYTAFLNMLSDAFQETKTDATEENIQARIRGAVLMALSNKFGWLVLSTGNKSEMSVGYATLYGDMAGGLSVLKDVPKTMVYRLARFRNAMTSSAVIPEHTLQRAPTAELRADQTDQDILPPYDILDPILEAYVEGNQAVAKIAALGFDASTVEQVGRMVDGCEYKRRQAPVGIKITSRALGKDRRMPVTNRYTGTS